MRVTVAGLGPRGREWVRTIRATPGMVLAACADPDEAVRREAMLGLGLDARQCFADLDAALDGVPSDAVIVATTLDRHVEPCRAALSRGRALLVEKPFALDLGDAAGLVAEAEARRVPLVVGQSYRYTRAVQAARRVIASGRLGRIGAFSWRAYRGPEQPTAAATRRVPNGWLWEVGIHHLDALRHVFSAEPDRVLAHVASPPWGAGPGGAAVAVRLAFDSGMAGSYEALYDSRGHEFFERGQELYLRVAGERGTLHVLHRWLVWCERGRWPRLVRRGPRRESEDAGLLRQLAESRRTGVPPEASGRDNLATLALVAGCARSAAEERWVEPGGLLHAVR
jgi:predicted dehydrogenase